MPAMLCRAGAAACSELLPAMARAGPRGLPCGGGPVPLRRGAGEHSGSVEGTGNSLSALPPSRSHFCSDCARDRHQTRLEIKPLLWAGGTPGCLATPCGHGGHGPEDVGSLLPTELRWPHLWCPSVPGCVPALPRPCRKGRMCGREEEISAGRQTCWHGNCAVQVILDWCRAPARLWLPAFVEGKAEVRCAAGSGELEFPGQLPEPRRPVCRSHQTQPLGSAKCIPGSSDLPQVEAWLWAVPGPSPMRAVRSKGGLCSA